MAVALVVAVLAAHNLGGNLVVPPGLYVPVNLATTAVVVAIARAAGLGWADLGLDRADAGRGLSYGAAAFAVVAVVLVAGALLPLTRPLFDDDRVTHLGPAAAAYQALVRIPLGTVVLEEVAFRGVLLALLARSTSTGAAVVWSSALFGLWHVVPSVEALRANELPVHPLPVAGAVAVTAVAGVVFSWLRLASGSLLAPALAHVATNSVALVLAVVVARWR